MGNEEYAKKNFFQFFIFFFPEFFLCLLQCWTLFKFFFFEKCCLFFVIFKPTMNFFQKCNSICALYHDLHQVPKGHIYSRGFGNWNQLGCGLWTQLGIIELFLLLCCENRKSLKMVTFTGEEMKRLWLFRFWLWF